MSAGPGTVALTVADVEQLLFEEAARLDERRLDAWLELFTDDAHYWLPMGAEDPRREPSLVFDDRARMEERVFRLMDTAAYAQMPPSRTQHDITNVRILSRDDGDGHVRVACNLVVHEVRIGDPSQVGLGVTRSLAGRCEYLLRRQDEGWLFAEKVVRLLGRELPQYNLTFII
jgi:p-cumate 2,3-dioxygenase beta subunit